ncbi:FAD-dependent monooxygenase [Hyphomonas sp.]|jgi:2-octaprenyl-6-methoxyphenol hydroxylase|uniref:FAD-dependent monooxygenase n=1 Tax=Hyphomonas sp. TaxID=87 RepID=UPI0032D8B8E1
MTKTALQSDRTYDLAIVGAGPVGTTLAILAANRGFSVILIDARDPDAVLRQDTRTFAIVRGSWRLLGAAGVTEALCGLTEPLNGLEAIDGGTHWFGAPGVLFGNEDLPDDPDGQPLGQMVPAAALQARLDEACGKTDGIDWVRGQLFEAMVTGPAGATLTLSGGSRIETRLVAACDGMKSSVRAAAGITTEGHDYNQSVFAANVKLARPHGGIARQLFTPEGPFATLPMPDNRANLAWYMKRGAAEAMAAMSVEDINAELNARFAEFAGPMEIDGLYSAYPLVMQLATRMVGARTALLGDAAHRINPLAGQGLNLGFKDVGALIDVMCEARDVGLDPGSDVSLERYEKWRRFDATAAAMFMDGIDRAFTNDSNFLKPLRGLALTLAQRVAPLRQALARQASADQEHLPSLMR